VNILIYVAGPLGTTDPFSRAGEAIRYADRLRAAGYACVVPHLNVLWAVACPGVPYEEWMRLDLALLERCDALVRLPGVSPGADREVAAARAWGIPVVAVDPLGPLPDLNVPCRVWLATAGAAPTP